jgi:hypothetical protein
MPASLAPFDMACALLREGRLADAEQLMVKELQAAERRHGRGSPEWASAQCDLGNILLGGDQPKRAVECFRSACSGPVPKEPGARKDYLTYQLNLGLVLATTGRLDEAETELRRNLQERLAFYGREHAGYTSGWPKRGTRSKQDWPPWTRRTRTRLSGAAISARSSRAVPAGAATSRARWLRRSASSSSAGCRRISLNGWT